MAHKYELFFDGNHESNLSASPGKQNISSDFYCIAKRFHPQRQDDWNISFWWICFFSNINSLLIFAITCVKANFGPIKCIWSHWGCFVATWALEASENVLYPLHLHCLTSKVGGSRKTTWASPGQQDNTGNLPCQVLEKKLRHILERNLETLRLFLLTSPWKPLRMFYSLFILLPHLTSQKTKEDHLRPHQDNRTPSLS